ncbi:MAG: glutamate 5-kinase [Alphaproteobacteria bacterium]
MTKKNNISSTDTHKILNEAQRIVFKIGSSTLVDEQYNIRHNWLYAFAKDVAQLTKQGKEVIIVSSGSIAIGKPLLKLKPPLSLAQKQAAASVGMGRLTQTYEQAFHDYNLPVGQVLLTLEDSEIRSRYLNARNTILTLSKFGAIPIINENDTVATDEIKVGDNDRLAARVAAMTSADLLVMLSDIDGLYTANPRQDTNAQHIPLIDKITSAIEHSAQGAGSDVGTGGMITKIMAAKICMEAGVSMILMNGNTPSPITRLQSGERFSLFKSHKKVASARKTWIATSLKPMGEITINQGAEAALKQGKSILCVGVIKTSGLFTKGDAIAIFNENGLEIARGLINYNSEDTCKITGLHSDEIEDILGYKNSDSLIHRDNLILF